MKKIKSLISTTIALTIILSGLNMILINQKVSAAISVQDDLGITWYFNENGSLAENIYTQDELAGQVEIPSILKYNSKTYTVNSLGSQERIRSI